MRVIDGHVHEYTACKCQIYAAPRTRPLISRRRPPVSCGPMAEPRADASAGTAPTGRSSTRCSRAGELPALAALIARGQPRRLPLLPALPLVGGLADVPDRPRPGRPRRLRHPRVPARRQPPAARVVRARSWRPPGPQRLTEAGRTTLLVNVPADLSRAGDQGRRHRRRRDPAGRDATAIRADAGPRLGWPINGGSWTTFRHRPLDLIDDVEARHPRAAPRRCGTLLDEAAVGRRLHGVRHRPTGSSTACSSTSTPGIPAFAEASTTPTSPSRVRGVYRLLDAELGTLLGRVDDDDLVLLMSDHGHQPVTQRSQHEPRARAPRPAADGARLGRWCRCWPGVGCARSPARSTTGSACTGRSRCRRRRSTGSTPAPTPASRPPARACRSPFAGREPEGIVAPEDYERVRDEVAQALQGVRRPVDRAASRWDG